jgi:drug/metabolite transporter (DMT)-like permease
MSASAKEPPLSLSFSQLAQLLSFAFLIAIGNTLFKLVANSSPKISDAAGLLSLLGNPLLWIAGTLYFGTTFFWIFILQQVPLSRAYPFAALGFVLVPIFSYFLLGESVSVRLIAGTGFILIGVYLAGLAPS